MMKNYDQSVNLSDIFISDICLCYTKSCHKKMSLPLTFPLFHAQMLINN